MVEFTIDAWKKFIDSIYDGDVYNISVAGDLSAYVSINDHLRIGIEVLQCFCIKRHYTIRLVSYDQVIQEFDHVDVDSARLILLCMFLVADYLNVEDITDE